MASVIVEAGIYYGSADTSGYWRIGHPTAGKIPFKLAGGPVWVDYSDRLSEFTVSRTSSTNGPLVEWNASTMTCTLRNTDGVLDPTLLSQPPPGSAIRIRKVHAGISYPIFRGYVDSWVPSRSPTEAAISVIATDGMDLLSRDDRAPLGAPVGAGELTSDRVGRILDSAGWPTSERSISVGSSTVQGATLGGRALDEIKLVTKSEVGEFFVDPNGMAVFRGRQVLRAMATGESVATFGTDLAGGELPYAGHLGSSYDRRDMSNVVRATRVSGAQQTRTDAASVARYRESAAPSADGLLLETDTEVASWAGYVLRQQSVPQFRVTSLTVDARVAPSLLYPVVLGAGPSDRMTVVRRAPGGIVDPQDVLVRSIQHTWRRPDQWRTTYGFAPAAKYDRYWRIGHPILGRIGTPLAF